MEINWQIAEQQPLEVKWIQVPGWEDHQVEGKNPEKGAKNTPTPTVTNTENDLIWVGTHQIF